MKSNYFFLLLLFVVGSNLFGMDERSEQVNRALHNCVEKMGRAAANQQLPDQAVIALAEELLQKSDVVYDQSILIDIFQQACLYGYENIVNLLVKIIDLNDRLFIGGLSRSCCGNYIKITKILLDAHEFDLLCTVDNCVML